MEYKILDENDIELMERFVDDENTHYDKEKIKEFIKDKNAYGFIIKNKNEIIGFAYGYVLLRPDGRKDFYMHAIDVIEQYQGNGYGTKLMVFIKNYIKTIECRKMFLITNKGNISACKCYKKDTHCSNSINRHCNKIALCLISFAKKTHQWLCN